MALAFGLAQSLDDALHAFAFAKVPSQFRKASRFYDFMKSLGLGFCAAGAGFAAAFAGARAAGRARIFPH